MTEQVTQADRDACRKAQVDLLIGGFQGDENAWSKAEEAFARHRIEATRQLEAGNAKLVEALRGIEEFGFRHPGHGHSCATIAKEALAKHGPTP